MIIRLDSMIGKTVESIEYPDNYIACSSNKDEVGYFAIKFTDGSRVSVNSVVDSLVEVRYS